MKSLWTPHPVMPEPTQEDIFLLAGRLGVSPELALAEAIRRRTQAIQMMDQNPMECGFEPPAWKLCDCLMAFPWVAPEDGDHVQRFCGFDRPIKALLINGGQRGGKSEYAAKRVMKLMKLEANCRAWMLHSNWRMSVEYQQPLCWKFLPANLKRKDVRTRREYIKYSEKTGFSDNRFILPNGSDCSFLTYEMDVSTVEGGNVRIIAADELVPSDWVSTMMLRIAEKSGWIIVSFTPIHGYSDTVRMFCDGGRVTVKSTAYLLDKDGKGPDVARALGITPEKLDRLERWIEDPKRHQPISIWSQPQTMEDFERGSVAAGANLGNVDGREFETVPRVMRAADPEGRMGVVWFHSSDNPYGNPVNVWKQIARRERGHHRERFYGLANKLAVARFPKFSLTVHVVDDKWMARQEGTNYHLVDPSSARNFFMCWARRGPEKHYIYREWPGNYYIPNVGVPGPWAEPDGKKLDGRPGPATRCWGWGLCEYKREIARLEGWEEYLQWEKGTEAAQPGEGERQKEKSVNELVAGWNEWGPKREWIFQRFMDARFSGVKGFDQDGMKTLLEEFDDVGITFHGTSSDSRESIDEGVSLVNDALSYDETKPISNLNAPTLYIAESCANIIFAMQTWTGKDGLKGATKDPIDVVRYYFLKACEYVPMIREVRVSTGGVY